MGSDVSHFNVPLIVRPDKVRRRCPQTTGFELKRKESGRSGFERRHPSYQPNALPLGQIGSQMPAGQARRFWQLCMLGHKTFAQSTTTKQRERERERERKREREVKRSKARKTDNALDTPNKSGKVLFSLYWVEMEDIQGCMQVSETAEWELLTGTKKEEALSSHCYWF